MNRNDINKNLLILTKVCVLIRQIKTKKVVCTYHYGYVLVMLSELPHSMGNDFVVLLHNCDGCKLNLYQAQGDGSPYSMTKTTAVRWHETVTQKGEGLSDKE
jgi:hypothetical protein